VPLVVVNKPGAGGTLAADFVAKQPGDGYSLLVAGGSESTSVPNHREVSYSLDDFRPVLRNIRARIILVSKTGSGIDSIEDLIAKANAEPGKLAYSSSGTGSLYHSTMLLFNKAAGTEMKHVPYKGGAPAMAALLGGHVEITMAAPEEAQAQYAAGQINLLALTSSERTDLFPDVPTLQELGHDVYLENQKGIVGPASMPDDVYQYLHDTFKKGMDSPVWQKMAAKLKLETSYMNGPDFKQAMTTMSKTIGDAVSGL
jgi:tripartite-type tricarboxylate transporter receptor subunit TctC